MDEQKENGEMEVNKSESNYQIEIVVVPTHGSGLPKSSYFKITSCEIPCPEKGEILTKTLYISVDPYLRGALAFAKIGDVPASGAVVEVINSNHDAYKKGDIINPGILSATPWRLYNTMVPTIEFRKLNPKVFPISTALGAAGMPGMTAYVGLLHVAKLKSSDKTVVVSGAAGAVGSLVGQIAKLRGCYVVGTAGTAEKIDYITKELGFDTGINYKKYMTKSKMFPVLKEACPDGIDIYFDNTGGVITSCIWDLLNKHARVVICGQISNYNIIEPPIFEDILYKIIPKCIHINGFVLGEYLQHSHTFYKDIIKWIVQDNIKCKETIWEGLENVPKAFIGLFTGMNTGKFVVKI